MSFDFKNPLRRCLGMALPQPRKDMKTHIWTRRMLHYSVTSLWSHSFPTAIINKHFYHSYFGKNTVTTPLWDRSSETIKEKTEFHCMCVGTIPQRTIIKMPIVYRCWDNPSSKKKLLVVKKQNSRMLLAPRYTKPTERRPSIVENYVIPYYITSLTIMLSFRLCY